MNRISSHIDRMQESYDVIVVGSGYGGGISASRLARAGKKVCLLERGKEILPGDFFTGENVAFAWPPEGINAEFIDLVTGMKASRYIKKGEIINWKDVLSA